MTHLMEAVPQLMSSKMYTLLITNFKRILQEGNVCSCDASKGNRDFNKKNTVLLTYNLILWLFIYLFISIECLQRYPLNIISTIEWVMVEIFLLNLYEFIFHRQLQCPFLPLTDVAAKPIPKNPTFFSKARWNSSENSCSLTSAPLILF